MWECDNSFYQKLAPIEWQKECAGNHKFLDRFLFFWQIIDQASFCQFDHLPLTKDTDLSARMMAQYSSPSIYLLLSSSYKKKPHSTWVFIWSTRGSSSKSKGRPLNPEELEAMKKLEKRVKRYLPVELDVDTSYLNNTQVNNCKVCFGNKGNRLHFTFPLYIGASSGVSDQCC